MTSNRTAFPQPEQAGPGGTAIYPLVSVIMPIRNEARTLPLALASVLAQDYPPDRLEIWVVDGYSADGSREYIQNIAKRDQRVHLLDNPDLIAAAAMNRGIAAARGTVIVRVDGHCSLPPNYVRYCVERLQAGVADNVGGVQVAVGSGYIGRAIALAQNSFWGTAGVAHRQARREGYSDTVFLGSWRRETLIALGGFDESLIHGQDAELNGRLRARGGRILVSPQIPVTYFCRNHLLSLAGQYAGYGYWRAVILARQPETIRWRHLLTAAGVLISLLALLGGLLWPVLWWGTALTAGLYLLVTGLAAVQTTGRDSRRYLPVLPLVFALLHLTWGIGFWYGVISWGGPGRVTRQLYPILKRGFDLLGALFGLFCLGLIVPLIALINRLTSPGPLFYSQERVGWQGRRFRCYKLRTMVPNAEADGQPVWASENDGRVTWLGRFLRRSHLDEMPQFWNVLKGEMSLVGPRPERPEIVEQLRRQLPDYEQRHTVRPGMAGLALVELGYTASLDETALKLVYDLVYVKRASFCFDLCILWRAWGTVLGLKGR